MIEFFAFGTYYKKGSPAAGDNADEMQRLVYQVKNKYWPGGGWAKHPSHPKQQDWIKDHSDAVGYLVDLVQANINEIRNQLNLEDDAIQFIPVPSSDVTRATIETARWSGREVARRLQARSLGYANLSVVCKKTGISKEGLRRNPTFQELVDNYEVITQPFDGYRIVYFDDVITWGTHIAAMDYVLGGPEGSCAVGLARTDGKTYDAYSHRYGQIVQTTGGFGLECTYGDPADPYVEDPPSDDDPW